MPIGTFELYSPKSNYTVAKICLNRIFGVVDSVIGNH